MKKGGGTERFSEAAAEFWDEGAFLVSAVAFLHAEHKSCGAQGGANTPQASPQGCWGVSGKEQAPWLFRGRKQSTWGGVCVCVHSCHVL